MLTKLVRHSTQRWDAVKHEGAAYNTPRLKKASFGVKQVRLGSKGRYAVTALADIAAQPAGRPVPLGDIALRHNLSIQYLEQIFVRLRRAGIVESARGPGGGYALARPSTDISLATILMAAGEVVQTTGCKAASAVACTGKAERCLTHGLWADLGDHIGLFFNTRSLADIIGSTKSGAGQQAAPGAEASA